MIKCRGGLRRRWVIRPKRELESEYERLISSNQQAYVSRFCGTSDPLPDFDPARKFPHSQAALPAGDVLIYKKKGGREKVNLLGVSRKQSPVNPLEGKRGRRSLGRIRLCTIPSAARPISR